MTIAQILALVSAVFAAMSAVLAVRALRMAQRSLEYAEGAPLRARGARQRWHMKALPPGVIIASSMQDGGMYRSDDYGKTWTLVAQTKTR